MSFDDGNRRSLRRVMPAGVELELPVDYQLFVLALYLWDGRLDVVHVRNLMAGDRGELVRKARRDWDEELAVRDDQDGITHRAGEAAVEAPLSIPTGWLSSRWSRTMPSR